jgi:hypothetical protein
MATDRTYRSKVDTWLVAVVLGAAMMPLAVGTWLLVQGEKKGAFLLVIWGGTMSMLMVALGFPLRYTLRSDQLHVKSGWLEWSVPLATLRRVAPSRNPLSAPAWSIRRLRLDSADGSFILVSPDDQESFISEIAERCPHLVRRGFGLEASSPSP